MLQCKPSIYELERRTRQNGTAEAGKLSSEGRLRNRTAAEVIRKHHESEMNGICLLNTAGDNCHNFMLNYHPNKTVDYIPKLRTKLLRCHEPLKTQIHRY